MEWTEFFEAQSGRDIRPTMNRVCALRGDAPPGAAVDVGCGDGTESRFLVKNGWRVHAIDAESGTLDRVPAGLSVEEGQRLTVQQASFEELSGLPQADLVYSGFALPFCAPAAFAGFWAMVRTSLGSNGWFAGELFGPNDEWASRPDMNFHSREQVEELFDGMEVLELIEDDRDGRSAMGHKHWHVFHIIARGPESSTRSESSTSEVREEARITLV